MSNNLDGYARKYRTKSIIDSLEQNRNVATRAAFINLREKYGADALDEATSAFGTAVYDGEAKAADEAAWTTKYLKENFSPLAEEDVRPPKPYRPAAVEGRTMSTTPTMSAEAKINALVAAKVADGLPRAKAHEAVMKENPALREAWVAEANAPRKPESNSAPPSQAKEQIMALVAERVADGVPYSKAYADTLKANPKLHQQWIEESQPGYQPPAKPTAPTQSAAAAPPVKANEKSIQEMADAFLEDRASRCI